MQIRFPARHIAVVFTLLCLPAAAESFNPAQFLPISASIVRVTATQATGRAAVGSGVTVAPSVIATSCHVIREASDIQVGGAGGTWNVDAESADVRRDVCLLRVPSWQGTPVHLPAPADALQTGATVVALGFTGGMAITPRFGHIRALHDFDGGQVIEADAPFTSGSSGGGLFAKDGTLIGLLTFRLRNSDHGYYSVPVEWVREQLGSEPEWSAVHPLHEGGTPFWQGDNDDLPAFMRVADAGDAQPAADSAPRVNDFPTHARSEYVLGCMREHNMAQEALYKCSCAIDAIAAKVDYETWVDLSTVANATTIAGERGGVMRDMKDGRKLIAVYREIQDNAKKSCFLQ
ncbi:MAG: S1 family peptidase [Betaproteobacteria bacterium]